MKIQFIILCSVAVLISCGGEIKKPVEVTETVLDDSTQMAKLLANDSITNQKTFVACKNDSLDELACLIAGIDKGDSAIVLNRFFKSKEFRKFSMALSNRWIKYDTIKYQKLVSFQDEVIKKNVETKKTLFYPFSGPDILYAQTFFPEADQYIMMGLEPVGTLPIYDEEKIEPDSMGNYYSAVNTSLHAILKFSFFRTASMKEDLRNEEEDGTVHLLLLFLKRMGNDICSAKPITVDSLGAISYYKSFPALKKKGGINKGVEIVFTTKDKVAKKLYYYSLNLADGGLKYNKGMAKYLNGIGEVNTYLKGASYLMHKDYFSAIKNVILDKSSNVVQDDSGIAFKYFLENGKFDYSFYGDYIKPIPMFKEFYQADLDSMYKLKGAKEIGFGIGYNFKDKRSNLMFAKRKSY